MIIGLFTFLAFISFFYFRYNDFSLRKEGEINQANLPLIQWETRGLSAMHGPTFTHPTATEQEKDMMAKL